MTHKRSICVLGGTGFVGSHILSRLAARGHRLRVLTRRPERRRDLLVLPTVDLVAADVHDPETLEQQFRGMDAVINLVGILNEPKDDGSGFRRVHVDLSRKVLDACAKSGVARLLHMSALNAHPEAPSHYLQSKGEAENLVHAAGDLDFRVTSFRPAVIFGSEDGFFNRFAGLLKTIPLFFPLACPQARIAPVFVEDVAEAFARALDMPDTYGQRYDLCGPDTYTLRELVEYTAQIMGLNRRIIPLSERMSRLQADMLERVPGKPFSRDNFRSLQVDAVCEDGFPDLFEITPSTVEAVVPRYLARKGTRQRDRYNDYRRGY